MLPSAPLCPGFEVLWSSWRRSNSKSQCRPGRYDKTRNPCQPIGSISSCIQTSRVRMFLQPCHDGVGDHWVTPSHHEQTVCPAGPTCAQTRFHSTAQTQPTKHKGDRRGFLDGVNLIRNHVEQPTHAVPQTLIVCCGKRS